MTTRPLHDRRILAVEDEWYIAKQLQRDLAAAGAVVLGPVPSVADALKLIDAEQPIDAAVLDVNLRGEKSFAVADALVARSIPFVFATGYTDNDMDARYLGVSRCIKPLEFRDLERALVSLL